jgi:hypothetical protein
VEAVGGLHSALESPLSPPLLGSLPPPPAWAARQDLLLGKSGSSLELILAQRLH